MYSGGILYYWSVCFEAPASTGLNQNGASTSHRRRLGESLVFECFFYNLLVSLLTESAKGRTRSKPTILFGKTFLPVRLWNTNPSSHLSLDSSFSGFSDFSDFSSTEESTDEGWHLSAKLYFEFIVILNPGFCVLYCYVLIIFLFNRGRIRFVSVVLTDAYGLRTGLYCIPLIWNGPNADKQRLSKRCDRSQVFPFGE